MTVLFSLFPVPMPIGGKCSLF